jgi:hypothetical protein
VPLEIMRIYSEIKDALPLLSTSSSSRIAAVIPALKKTDK